MRLENIERKTILMVLLMSTNEFMNNLLSATTLFYFIF